MKRFLTIAVVVFVVYKLFLAPSGGSIPIPDSIASMETGSELSISYLTYHPKRENDKSFLPLVVLLHGQGDTAKNFYETFVRDYEIDARIVSINAPYGPSSSRRSWGSTLKKKQEGIQAIAYAIQELREIYPTSGDVHLLGYSLGGGVALALAAEIPEEFDKIIPVSAYLRKELYPERGNGSAPNIIAFHGTSDSVVKLGAITRAQEHFDSIGISIELREYNGVGHHGIFKSFREDVLETLEP